MHRLMPMSACCLKGGFRFYAHAQAIVFKQ